MGAADRFRLTLTNTGRADLALFDQLAHRTEGFFDRHLGIDAMLEIQIDDVGIEALHDLNEEVRNAAACALGCMGNRDVLPLLSRMLRDAPSIAVIDAVSRVADEDCIILLGRILKSEHSLSVAAREALDAMDHPRAAQIIGNART